MWILLVALLVPLALVDVPPLLDYPNHLARAFVLAFGAGDPVLSRMYAPHWAIIPNLGIDLVLPPLLRLLPAHVAGRVVIGCAIVLPVLGTIAYSRAIFGTRSLWPSASALVAYNGTLLLGFLNFNAGLGLAMLAAAVWIRWRERYPLSVVTFACCAAIALFFCHLMSLAFCVILVCGYEAEWIWHHRQKIRAVVAHLASAAVVLIGPLVLYTLSPLSPVSAQLEWPTLTNKAREFLMPFANYILPLDIVTAVAVIAFVSACASTGRCRMPPRASIAVAVTAALFLAAPNAVKGSYLFDTRFVIMLGFLLFGALLPERLPRAAAMVASAGFVALFATRMAVVGEAWFEHRQDLAELRTTIASVPPGARVFLATVSPTDAPRYWRNGPISRRLSLGLPLDDHVAALLLIERRAFWPFLFDNPSQQPIETLPPYRALAERAGMIADVRALGSKNVDLVGYDDVLLLYAGGVPSLAAIRTHGLELIANSDMAALFQVTGRTQ